MFRVSQVTAWMGSWSTCLVASSTFSLQTEATSLWRISAMLKVYFISTTTVLTSRQNQTIDSSATCFVLFSLQVPTCWKWLWRRMDIISTHTSTKLLFIHLRPRAKKLMTKRKIVKVKVGTWELDFFFHPLLQKVCADNTHGQTKMTCECLCVHPSQCQSLWRGNRWSRARSQQCWTTEFTSHTVSTAQQENMKVFHLKHMIFSLCEVFTYI